MIINNIRHTKRFVLRLLYILYFYYFWILIVRCHVKVSTGGSLASLLKPVGCRNAQFQKFSLAPNEMEWRASWSRDEVARTSIELVFINGAQGHELGRPAPDTFGFTLIDGFV